MDSFLIIMTNGGFLHKSDLFSAEDMSLRVHVWNVPLCYVHHHEAKKMTFSH